MTFDCRKCFQTLLLYLIVIVLCSTAIPALAGKFTLDHLEITSNPTDGTTYTAEREIASDTKRIKKEDWDPQKVPPRITYTIEAYAKGPGTITFYLDVGSDSQDVGSWENGSPLSDGEGTYEWSTYRLNEDNYDFANDYDAPYYDPCVPYLNKGYQSEVVESTNSTLSIGGGRATFNGIDTHVGRANTKKTNLKISAGWNTAEADVGYASSSTQSWIYRPSTPSLQVPETSLSLSGSFSVDIDDTEVSGSEQEPPPRQCVPCAGCDKYMYPEDEFAHRRICFAPKHVKALELVHYYICVPEQLELHKKRTCGRFGCGKTYHNCSPGDPGCFWWPASHKEDGIASTSDSPGLSPDGGLYAASPGGSHTASLTTSVPYNTVYWYVKKPWDTSYYGTNEATDSGDGLTNEASFSYTFPSGSMHTGSFKITAYIYTGDSNIQEYSYTVTVQ